MYRDFRRWTYEMFAPELGGRIGRAIDWAIMGLILVNVLATIIGTVDTVAARFGPELRLLEVFSVAIFSIEYVGRVWAAVEDERYEPAITGRLRFMRKPLLIVDLLAILPFYISIGVGADLRFLRALRLIRVLRIAKMARYSAAMNRFSLVFKRKGPDLIIALFANVLLLVVVSSLMYVVESSAQPDHFSSIPATMWWGVVTLTTVGYGNVYPVTPLGRILGAIVAVLGVGLFAIPSSILASGFIDSAEEMEESSVDADDLTGDGFDCCPLCDQPLTDDTDSAD